jgi:hypothetical protein
MKIIFSMFLILQLSKKEQIYEKKILVTKINVVF